MKDSLALRSILAHATVFALVLLIIAGAVALDWAKYIIPSPETTAAQLVDALGAHRYEGAVNQLSQELRQQVSEQDLKSLVQSIESSQNGIYEAYEGDAHEQGQTATAQVKVKLRSGREQTLEFSLKKENGLWKISSLEPLQSLAGSAGF